MNKRTWYFGPGALRISLALLVVISHMSTLKLGGPAVLIFFALSGYWVTKMYADKYRSASSLFVFYASRAMRIWPAFAVAFLIAFFALNLSSMPRDVSYLSGLLLFGVATTKMDVLGISWSLDIEMQFYVAVPLILALWSHFEVDIRARIAYAATITLILTILGHFVHRNTGIALFLLQLPCFMTGFIIWASNYKPSQKTAFFSLSLFVFSAAMLALHPESRFVIIRHGSVNQWWWPIFTMMWLAILIPFVAWNVRQSSGWLDRHLGNLSYSLYITHFPVIGISASFLAPLSINDRVFILGLVLIVAILFYLIVDRYFERMRERTIKSADVVKQAKSA
ncbi:MAG: acyltransferase family protein [Candidatus Paceibacteria bacterium]